MRLRSIQEMASNARRPDLTDFTDYSRHVDRLNKETEAFVRALP
jgi:hypothetical protein